MYKIELTAAANKALLKMPRNVAAVIRSKIDGLAAAPYAPKNNVKKLKAAMITVCGSAIGASFTNFRMIGLS